MRVNPSALPCHWRSIAESNAAILTPEVRSTLERCAGELEAAWQEYWDEALPLENASVESGYDVGSLGRMVREQRVPNAGRKNSPRILRKNLPRKPGSNPALEPRASGSSSLDPFSRRVLVSTGGGR